MQMLTTFLTYGYLMIVGALFLIMLIQVLAFYIAGRLTGSINDEFTSALSLFGALFLIGMGSSLANVGIKSFMPGSYLPLIAAAVLFLFITVYTIMKIYDLSVLSAILHFIISFGIMVITIIALGYLATRFVPEGGFQMNLGTVTDSTAETATNSLTESEDMNIEENKDNAIEVTEGTTGEPLPGSPKLPSVAGSDTACIYDIDCEDPNDFCFSGTCQTVEEISSQFTATENCESYTCANCATSSLSMMPIGMKTGNYNVCVECNLLNAAQPISCITGFTCENYKCVATQ